MGKKYVITSAQYGAAVNTPFLNSLITYCKANRAELVVLPMIGISLKDVALASSLSKFELDLNKDHKLNNKIKISGFKVRPNQIIPTTGMGRFAQSDISTVFASPKQHLQVVPNSNINLPKVLMSTGAVTYPHYWMETRIGVIAQRDHRYGAIVVDVKTKDKYQYRQISALRNGRFCDLGKVYSPDNITSERLEAIVLGDIHVGDTDPVVMKENLRMIRKYHPKHVILHDIFNGHSISHHHLGDIVTLAENYVMHGLSLENELKLCAAEIHKVSEATSDGKVILVASNHNEFLDRYLRSGRFIEEPHNLMIASKLLTALLEGYDPLEYGIYLVGGVPENVTFLERDQDYKVKGWQLGSHGDLGANGARRASPRTKENAYGKSISGHSHSCCIFRDTYIVGTSTYLKLDYNRGPSSWTHTHALVGSTGKVQLVNIVDGKHT